MEAVQESDLFAVRKITLGVPRRWCAWPLIRGLSDLPHVALLQDCPATIAERLGLSEKAVESRLTRAREAFRKTCEERDAQEREESSHD